MAALPRPSYRRLSLWASSIPSTSARSLPSTSAHPFSTTTSHRSAADNARAPVSASAQSRDPSSNDSRVGRGRQRDGRSGPKMLPPFKEWINGEGKDRYKYPRPGGGPSWIGDTPFPLNPSFVPLPPISSKIKNDMWNQHSSNPAKWTPRRLSQEYNIAIARVEAVLRLKALEQEFKQHGKPLQTTFQASMERLLGTRRIRKDPEQEPLNYTKDRSTRGPQREEFAEHEDDNTPSVLAPALEAASKARGKLLSSLPTGGPDPRTASEPVDLGRTSWSASTSDPASTSRRPALTVVDVSGVSYEGAGTVSRNERRAAKKAEQRKRRRERGDRPAAPNAALQSGRDSNHEPKHRDVAIL